MADNSNIERIGHELVAKDAAQFIAKMRDANKASERFLDTLERAARKPVNLVPQDTEKRLGALRHGLTDVTVKLLGYRGGLGGVIAQSDAFKNMLASLNPQMVAVAGGLAALTLGAIKLGGALMQLGARGAIAEGVVFAFSRIAAVADTSSDQLLGAMRQAAAGTVSDLDLMKRANLALAGAQGQTAKQIAQSLPRLLEISRAQARATGQDVNFLFESIVSGVKRTSPMLIDNTGIVLKVGAANEALAAKLNKTVEQLTDEEKQLALLNATLEAGQRAVELYGVKQRTAAELMSSFQVRISNFMDRLALAIQPAYTLILEVGDALLASIITPLQDYVIPLIYELTKAFIGPLQEGWRSFKAGIEQAAGPALDFLRRAMVPAIASIRLLGQAWAWLVEATGRALRPILDLIKAFVERILGRHLNPQKFFEGGARAFGALAQGILKAANDFIFPAVLFIAQTIADFLVGMSPPPKGPLSMIDKGGENTMLAWMAGFTGVSLDPVEDVATQVNEALGSIAGLGLEAVEARIAVLDAAIQPFEERLKIIEGRMNAILNPLKQIEGVLNRKLDTALGQFFGGKLDAESVRALDRQKEALQARMDSVQQVSDEAAYQLSLKQLEQVGERNLLEIQLARLKALEQEKGVAEKVEKIREETAKAGGGVEDQIAAAVGGGLGALSLPDDPIGAFLGLDEEAIRESMDGISRAFDAGFKGAGGAAELAKAQTNLAALQTQLKRIDAAVPGEKLKQKFRDTFGLGPDGIIADVVKWGTNLAAEVAKASDNIDNIPIFKGFGERFVSYLSRGGPMGVALSSFIGLITDTFSSGGKLSGPINSFVSFLGKTFDAAGPITGAFDMFNPLPLWQKFNELFDKPGFGIRQTLDNFLTKLTQFTAPDTGDIMGRLNLLNLDPHKLLWLEAFDMPGMGIVQTLDNFKNTLNGIFTEDGFIAKLFSGIGGIADKYMVQPVKVVLNRMIEAFENALNAIVGAVNHFTQSGAMGVFSELVGRIGLGDLKLNPVVIPRLRAGALSAQGMMQLHRDELVMAHNPVTVFPQQLSREIMRAIQGPQAAARTVQGPQTVTNTTSHQSTANVTNNFKVYGQQSLRLAMAQAKGWS